MSQPPTAPANFTTIYQASPVMPPKIQAALAFTSFCYQITTDRGREMGHDSTARALSSREQRCYDAALQSMTEYFNDDGWGDGPKPPPGGGNAPVVPQVPVTVP